MTLTSALQHLRKNGKTSDFDSQGFPRLAVLRDLMTHFNPSRQGVEDRWIELYGDERGRDPDA